MIIVYLRSQTSGFLPLVLGFLHPRGVRCQSFGIRVDASAENANWGFDELPNGRCYSGLVT